MGDIKKRHSPEFKATVTGHAIAGLETMAELASRFGVHPSQIALWKKNGFDILVGAYSNKANRSIRQHEAEIEQLRSIIGRLTVENDFLKKKIRR